MEVDESRREMRDSYREECGPSWLSNICEALDEVIDERGDRAKRT